MVESSLTNAITERYSEESGSCSTLGCGNNFDFLLINKGDYILDLGCGRGNDTIKAAKGTGKEGFAIGVDLTPEMVEKAKENAKEQKVENIMFTLGDIENIPFDNERFDKVLSNCVINHAKDKKRVYEEIKRVLKPGGSFVISDAVTKVPLPEEIKNNNEAWAECFGGAITESEYIAIIGQVGFRDLQILKRREYIKNGYEFVSLTIRAVKY